MTQKKSHNAELSSNDVKKVWSARFNEPIDALVKRYTASIPFDHRLIFADITASVAHVRMLMQQDILTKEASEKIVAGLQEIAQDVKKQGVQWHIDDEDVHGYVEKKLIEKIGEAGKKLHTGRSRNDQTVTDLRLWLRGEVDQIIEKITVLQIVILDMAETYFDTIIPGFTHLQIAQPITFGHHLMAYFEMLKRDKSRYQETRKRINQLPLGSAALAGTTYPIDREFVRQELAFDGLCENSLDAVSDRDFAIEFCHCSALLMLHLSRLSEELILWTNPNFNFIELSDGFCTGSSIMPQKKNPDVPELIRGKTGRVNGHLVGLLTLMKGQPLAYNKDNQEDKEALFDTVDTVSMSLEIYAEMLKHIRINKQKMAQSARQSFSTATDLADYLVKKGVSFRDAHKVVSSMVAYAVEHQQSLEQLSINTLQSFHEQITEDVYEVLRIESSVKARNHVGGTSPEQVKYAILRAKESLK